MGATASAAHADGDPASDVLASQTLFLPQDAGVPTGQQAQLASLIQEANRAGYPLRVALIASRTDLGSITELWHQPQNYARFLGQELGLVYHGALLVVMPNGYGITTVGSSIGAAPSLGDLPPAGAELATGALRAIQRAAGQAGHQLTPPRLAPLPTGPGAGTPLAWIVFAIGWALMALAWIISLRIRPLKRRERHAAA